ncbi:MAG: Cytochrome oxidase, cbb3-type, subunit [Acidobacteria bacterium]|nr:Cytochrome oxidase, cbb3-type, subunit [Acidobacteriota bacterium]
MNYPFWDVPIGYGILIAAVAILHVFISHFAIGGGFYLVVNERAARRAGDTGRLEFLKRLSKFFTLTTLVAGALTGVGIWFCIGLLSPAAVAVLIRNFVWAWAIEWTLFAVEIAAAIFYYYGWERMSAMPHMTLGWIYFMFAWLSLFVINGILTFMLTPGSWLETGDFWDGFFNPTFWPSLVLRSCIAAMLAGLYALLVASLLQPADLKARIARNATSWGICGLAAALVALYWYWKWIPPGITQAAAQRLPTPAAALQLCYGFAAAIALLLVLFGWVLPRRLHFALALILMASGLGFFGSFEWFRESIRKPYIITGFMYGNGVGLAHTEQLRETGYLAQIVYRTGNDGADLFRHACRNCHTMDGYKPLKPAFDGTDQAFVAAIIQSAHLLRGNMPPFLGTPAEAGAVAGYIKAKLDPRPLPALYGLRGVALGERVFQIRCGKCHPMGGQGDKTNSLAGLAPEDYGNMLDMASEMGVGMPAFTGDATERAALIEYLTTLQAGEKK